MKNLVIVMGMVGLITISFYSLIIAYDADNKLHMLLCMLGIISILVILFLIQNGELPNFMLGYFGIIIVVAITTYILALKGNTDIYTYSCVFAGVYSLLNSIRLWRLGRRF